MIRLEEEYSADEILRAAANILNKNEFPFKSWGGYSAMYYYAESEQYVVMIADGPHPPLFAFVKARCPEDALKQVENYE